MVQPINPPDGWIVKAGVWGTDFQRDTATYLTSNTSLKVVGTAANTQTLVGEWFPVDGNGVAYVVSSVLRATNNTSLFTLKLDIYAADQSTLIQTISLYSAAAVPTANVWLTASKEFQTSSNNNWARFTLTRASGETSSIYLDRVEVKKLGPRWLRYKNPGTGQTLGAGDTQISFGTSYIASLVTTSTTDVTVYRAGIYLLNFRTSVSGFTAGDAFSIYFKVNDPVWGAQSLGAVSYVAPASGVISVNFTSVYHHVGTTGAGTTVGVWVNYPGAAAPFVSANPAAPVNSFITAATSWSGTWLGLG